MRMVMTAVSVMALLAGTPPAGAAEPAGTVEICRPPGIVSITDGQLIALPVGFIFADTGDAGDRNGPDGRHRMVRLTLRQGVTIAARARCGSGQAAVTANPNGFVISPGEDRIYRPSGSFTGNIPEVVARVMTEFR